MIGRRAWHLRRRDLRFLGVVALTLAAIGAFLATESGAPETGVGGWRRIDRAALERRIESGELSRKEAVWWRAIDGPRQ
jgi:hypothetical protein